MRTQHTTLVIAIAAALLSSGSLSAQVKDANSGISPSGPSRGGSISELPGVLCSESSGTGCPGAIADNPNPGLVSQFTVSNCGGVIQDLKLGLDITHSWVGDLKITLVSPDDTEVIVYDPPGIGCSGNNIFAVADDAAGSPLNDQCAGGTPTIAGVYYPLNPLAAVNGEQGDGIWGLVVQDLAGGDTGTLNDWSLQMDCSEPEPRAEFEVNKVFTDDNPQDVEVTLSCFTGLPLVQSQTISQSQNVTFVVQSFADGALDCDVTEEPVAGYSASYSAGQPGSDDADGCHFDNLAWSTTTSCTITNEPQPVEIYVTKDWVIDGTGGDQLDPYYTLDLLCIDGEIIGVENTEDPWGLPYKRLYEGSENGTNDVTYTALVIPHWQYGAYCSVYELGYDDSVEVDAHECESFNV